MLAGRLFVRKNFKKLLTRLYCRAIMHINRTDNTEKLVGKKVRGKKNVFENIVDELKRLIESGAIPKGEKLPSVRSYAVERKVNPNTVAKAYTALEEAGYIRVLLKKGAFVVFGEEKERDKTQEIERCFAAFKASGVTRAELEHAIEKVFAGGEDV